MATDVEALVKSLRKSLAFAAPEVQDAHWDRFVENLKGLVTQTHEDPDDDCPVHWHFGPYHAHKEGIPTAMTYPNTDDDTIEHVDGYVYHVCEEMLDDDYEIIRAFCFSAEDAKRLAQLLHRHGMIDTPEG